MHCLVFHVCLSRLFGVVVLLVAPAKQSDWAIQKRVEQSRSHCPEERPNATCLHRLPQVERIVPFRCLSHAANRRPAGKNRTGPIYYHPWPVQGILASAPDNDSKQYTAFRTPSGLYHFTVLPFGLHGAPAKFQRLMDQVLRGCEGWAAAYLDDMVIFSNSWEEHLTHLSETLKRIREAGLTLNVKKCEWARQETSYLGYHLGNGKLRPQVDKVEAIRRSPRPRLKKEMISFLGLVGWYRRFLPDFATIATPLTNLLTKAAKSPMEWTKDCEAAFRTLKEKIWSSPVLQSHDFNQRFLVHVDESATGVGAVLAQGEVGAEKTVVYISRKLLPRETRYSTVEKECLAIKWSLESLRYYLLGREFDLETDHRALTWIQTMKDHNSRVMRWYLSLQPYKFKVRHRPGQQNVVADYLSHYPDSTRPREGGGDVMK